MPNFSHTLEKTLHRALTLALERQQAYAALEHLLLALTEDTDAMLIFNACNVDLKLLRNALIDYINADLSNLIARHLHETKPSCVFQRTIQRAVLEAQAANKDEICGADVLIAMFAERDSQALFFLQEQNMSRYEAINCQASMLSKRKVRDEQTMPFTFQENTPNYQDQKQKKKEPTSSAPQNNLLENYCVNLNKKALEGKVDPLIGRQRELNRTMQILCRRRKNNPIFVGDPGVGKTAIVEGLAHAIVHHKVPKILQKAVIYSLDMGSVLSGTRYRGDFEERLKQIIKAVEGLPFAILFIDEIHTIVGAGSTSGGAMDASNLLKPALANGSLRCIGSTTFQEYRKYFEGDHALTRRFQKIKVDEPTIKETIKIIRGLLPYFEEYHNLKFTDGAIRSAVELSVEHIKGRKLPDKAIDILDETGALQSLKSDKLKKKVISQKDIEQTLSMMTELPLKLLTKNDVTVLKNLESRLEKQIFGQHHAIQALCSSIKLARSGLRKKNKPTASYLFVGPTGVGKTEVVKQLSQHLGVKFLRFDMSEYMEKHSVSRLIGSPPGYIGYDQGGLLTDAVDQYPHCVLLLDEIEKAHHDIYNLLLQVMDYGKLTDHKGKQVSFEHAILVMTTNAGIPSDASTPIGFVEHQYEGPKMSTINGIFSSEFRNRLDSIISFNRLGKPVLEKIVDKLFKELEKSLEANRITLHVKPEVKDWVIEQGYDPRYGARPLDRLIESTIKLPLADEILFGRLSKGGIATLTLKEYNDKDQCKRSVPVIDYHCRKARSSLKCKERMD